MHKSFPLLLLLILAGGCTALQAPAPTPIIIIVTATPDTAATNAAPSNPSLVPIANPTQPLASPGTPIPVTIAPDAATSFPTKPTAVQYVRAKQDINIRKGPGTQYDIVGGVYAGQTAKVTGVTSADATWWRVICPDGSVGECWVSADSALTEPADAPNAEPTATASTKVNSETYVRALAAALQGKNFDALKSMMGDPFTIGYWLSEGTQPTRDQALELLKKWVAPASDIVIDVADKTDQTKLLNGTNPLGMWDPKVKVVKSVYVKGLGETGKDEALLIITQRDDKSLSWYGILYAAGGFVKGTQ